MAQRYLRRRAPSFPWRSTKTQSTSLSIWTIHEIVPSIVNHRRFYDRRTSPLPVAVARASADQFIVRNVVHSSTNLQARWDRSTFLTDTYRGWKHWRCRRIYVWRVPLIFNPSTEKLIARNTIVRAARILKRCMVEAVQALQKEENMVTGLKMTIVVSLTEQYPPKIKMLFLYWTRECMRRMSLGNHHPPAEGI